MSKSALPKNSISVWLLNFFGFEHATIHGESVIARRGATPMAHVCLVLKVWTNQARQRLYHRDVHFLLNASSRERERQLDPDFEAWPAGIVLMDVKTDGRLRVTFDPKKIDLSEILEYLARIGVQMEQVGQVELFPS